MKRGGRINPVSAKRAAQAEARRDLVMRVHARDRTCRAAPLLPGMACGGPLDVHELIQRSLWAGGYLVDENCILLCRTAHAWLHANPLLAQSMGLLVPGWAGLAGCGVAQTLRLLCGDGHPTFAPWLTDAERAATAIQDSRWLHAPTLEGWN